MCTSVASFVVCCSGSQEDVDKLIRGTSDVTRLASWCTAIKAELSNKESECRGLTESLRRAERDLELTETQLADTVIELNNNSARTASIQKVMISQVENYALIL